jgi:hypothetical protein
MMRNSSANPVWLLGLLGLLASALLGCKTKEVPKPDPETEKALADTRRSLEEKDKYIAKLQEENSRLMQKGCGELTVTIEGGTATAKPGPAGVNPQIDPKAAAAGAQEFFELVTKSKGSISKCYQQVLKKNAGLQSSKISLTVYATFGATGSVASLSSAPSLGEQFDVCFRQLTQKWVVKGASSSTNYQAVVELTPS